MDFGALTKAVTTGRKKASLMNDAPARYVARSVFAGFTLSLVVYLFWMIVQGFSGAPAGKLLGALFFGVGLYAIIMTKAELFTSNAMYLAQSSLARRTTWWQTTRLWGLCYLGNLAGALLLAAILAGAGVLTSMTADHALILGADHKIAQGAAAIFFKGILANWVVCLAVWVGLHIKDDAGRLFSTMAIVFIFVYLGFEHSIANMGTFAMALMSPSGLDMAGAVRNLFFATLGNIVGGAVGIGALTWWMDRPLQVANADERVRPVDETGAGASNAWPVSRSSGKR